MLCREDAVRLGLFIGGFTGLYSGAKDCLHRWRPSTGASAQCFAAGTIAGANAVLCLPYPLPNIVCCTHLIGAPCTCKNLKMQL